MVSRIALLLYLSIHSSIPSITPETDMSISGFLLTAFCGYCLLWQSHLQIQPPTHCLEEARMCTLHGYPIIPSQLALAPPKSSEILTSTALAVYASAAVTAPGSELTVPYRYQEQCQGDPACDHGMSWCHLKDSASLTSIQNKTLRWQATIQDLPCLPAIFLHTSTEYPPLVYIREGGRLFNVLGTHMQKMGNKTRTKELWYDCRGPHHAFVVHDRRFDEVWLDGTAFHDSTAWCIQWAVDLTLFIRDCDAAMTVSAPVALKKK